VFSIIDNLRNFGHVEPWTLAYYVDSKCQDSITQWRTSHPRIRESSNTLYPPVSITLNQLHI